MHSITEQLNDSHPNHNLHRHRVRHSRHRLFCRDGLEWWVGAEIMRKTMSEIGPIYGVPLIKTMSIGSGPMKQCMPSRKDLEVVREISERTAAGYEVLLSSHNDVCNALHFAMEACRENLAMACYKDEQVLKRAFDRAKEALAKARNES